MQAGHVGPVLMLTHPAPRNRRVARDAEAAASSTRRSSAARTEPSGTPAHERRGWTGLEPRPAGRRGVAAIRPAACRTVTDLRRSHGRRAHRSRRRRDGGAARFLEPRPYGLLDGTRPRHRGAGGPSSCAQIRNLDAEEDSQGAHAMPTPWDVRITFADGDRRTCETRYWRATVSPSARAATRHSLVAERRRFTCENPATTGVAARRRHKLGRSCDAFRPLAANGTVKC